MSNYFILSAHAETVMKERAIKLNWLQQTMAEPEKVETDKNDSQLKHALKRIAEYENRVLRVIYNDSVIPQKIITVYFDRTQKGKL